MTSRLEALLGMLVDQVLMSVHWVTSLILSFSHSSQLALSLVIWTVTRQTGKMAGPISRLID